MDLKKAIETRRSIRKFRDIPIPWHYIIDIADAARYAPTVGGLQNFALIAVVDPEKIDKIAEMSKQYWVKSAKALIVLCIDYAAAKKLYPDKNFSEHEVGAIMENMLLYATSLGLGSCWVESFDNSEMKDYLKAKMDVEAFVALGYPAEIPEKRYLKGFEEILHYNSFGAHVFDIREKIHSPRIMDDYTAFVKKIKRFFNKILRK